MAKIHLAKDGKRANGDHITRGFEVTPAQLAPLNFFPSHYRSNPPDIGTGVADDYAAFEHVVVEIEEPGEASTAFPKVGYYWLSTLSPKRLKELVALDFPEV